MPLVHIRLHSAFVFAWPTSGRVSGGARAGTSLQGAAAALAGACLFLDLRFRRYFKGCLLFEECWRNGEELAGMPSVQPIASQSADSRTCDSPGAVAKHDERRTRHAHGIVVVAAAACVSLGACGHELQERRKANKKQQLGSESSSTTRNSWPHPETPTTPGHPHATVMMLQCKSRLLRCCKCSCCGPFCLCRRQLPTRMHCDASAKASQFEASR